MKRLLAPIALFACAPTLSAATGSIAGTITDSVTNAPIAGARVMAGMCGQNATTGDDRTYIIGNVAPGDYTVKAMKCGAYAMKAYPEPVNVAEGQNVTGIDIALAPMGGGDNGSITGTVFDKKTNASIAGARVMVGGCIHSTLTADDGAYTISGLADGSYTVKAVKDGYRCATYPDLDVIEGGGAVTGINFYLEGTSNRALD